MDTLRASGAKSTTSHVVARLSKFAQGFAFEVANGSVKFHTLSRGWQPFATSTTDTGLARSRKEPTPVATYLCLYGVSVCPPISFHLRLVIYIYIYGIRFRIDGKIRFFTETQSESWYELYISRFPMVRTRVLLACHGCTGCAYCRQLLYIMNFGSISSFGLFVYPRCLEIH